MKFSQILPVAGLALAAMTTSAYAQMDDHHDGHGVAATTASHSDMMERHMNGMHHRHCAMQWRHHHRVRVCR